MSRLCQGCVKDVSRLCQGCVNAVSRLCQGCVKAVSRLCHGCVTAVSMLCQGRVIDYCNPVIIWVFDIDSVYKLLYEGGSKNKNILK